MTDFERKVEEELKKQQEAILKPNIAVVGGTGVGKSSLVNRFFGENFAEIGSGKPITKGMIRYEKENVPVVIYDTEGYEISSASGGKVNFDEKIKPEIERMNSGELKEQIHLVWYCISISGHRITNYDLDNIEYFSKNRMKIAVVLTQCDNDEEESDGSGKTANEFKKIIKERFSNIEIFETSAENIDLELDLDKLQEWSYEALDNDLLKQSFISAQKVSLEAKKKEAYKVVKIYTGTTATSAGLNPIPLSDALLIAPQQIAMCMQIAKMFNFDVMGESVQALLKQQVMSLVGKQLATSLLKLIS
jgi:GTP-binding protein EngB required for normal cell division